LPVYLTHFYRPISQHRPSQPLMFVILISTFSTSHPPNATFPRR
jgi:hypothetical protein